MIELYTSTTPAVSKANAEEFARNARTMVPGLETEA